MSLVEWKPELFSKRTLLPYKALRTTVGSHTTHCESLWAAIHSTANHSGPPYKPLRTTVGCHTNQCGGWLNMASMDAEFLREKVGARLAKAVAAASASGVSDKIDYIADWLLQQVRRCH